MATKSVLSRPSFRFGIRVGELCVGGCSNRQPQVNLLTYRNGNRLELLSGLRYENLTAMDYSVFIQSVG